MSDTSPCRFLRTPFISDPVGPSTNFCTIRDRNMFLNHIGKPSIHLPVCMALWGSHLRPTGVTRNFIGVLLACFFLGICESAFFPVSSHWRISRTRSHGMAGSIVPPFEMVQAQLTQFTNCCPRVREYVKQCLWLAHRFRDSRWYGRCIGTLRMEMVRCPFHSHPGLCGLT
jgi:hypothetical protein